MEEDNKTDTLSNENIIDAQSGSSADSSNDISNDASKQKNNNDSSEMTFTIGTLKTFLEKLCDLIPADTPIRTFDHYMGTTLNTNVYTKLKLKQIRVLKEGNSKLSFIIVPEKDADELDNNTHPMYITQEQENALPSDFLSAVQAKDAANEVADNVELSDAQA